MASEKLVIRSLKTGLEQTVTPEQRQTIDPYKTKFTVLKETNTPPEAKATAAESKKKD